jgi:hypothetical protein
MPHIVIKTASIIVGSRYDHGYANRNDGKYRIPEEISFGMAFSFGIVIFLSVQIIAVLFRHEIVFGSLRDVGKHKPNVDRGARSGAGQRLDVPDEPALAGELPNASERPKVITTFYFAGYIEFIVPIMGVGLLRYLFDLYVSLIVLNVLTSLVVLYMLWYSVRFARYYAARNGTQAQAEGLPSKAGSQACSTP